MAVALALLTGPSQARPKVERPKKRTVKELPAPWRLHERQPHFFLASRPYPAHGQREYFAELRVQVPPQALLALLQDTQRVTEWVHHAQGAEVIAHPAPGLFQVASRFNPPWPVRNRDLISESFQWQLGPQLWLEIKAIPNGLPNQPGYVRIQTMENCWMAQPEADGSTTLFHLGHVKDPGYSPDFLVNGAMTRSLIKTLNKLQRLLPAYQNRAVPQEWSTPSQGVSYCNTMGDLLELPWPQLTTHFD